MSWLRNWIRRRRILANMAPEKAQSWKTKLSLIYLFLTWNALGYVAYKSLNSVIKKKEVELDLEGLPETLKMAKILNLQKATVYRFDGLSYKGSEELQINPDEQVSPESQQSPLA